MSTVREEWGLACQKCGSDAHLEVQLATMAKIIPPNQRTIVSNSRAMLHAP